MARAVGIDLGTTNSVVAVLEGGEPTVIANAEGFRTTPSVVAFTKDGEVLVGETAKRQAVTNVDRTIASVKRHMGTDWTTDVDGKKYTPQEISARILAKLKRDAEQYLGEDRHRRRHHRSRVLQRRRAPGHQGRRRDRRPQRAAHHQRADRCRPGLRPRPGKDDELILVFDLGGGTFDVSLLEVGKDDDFSTIQVRSTAGDNRLGGDDWDQRIVEHLIKQVQGDHRRRRVEGQDRQAAPQGGRGAGEEGALVEHERQHPAAVPLAHRERPGQPRRDADPRASSRS